MAPVSGNANTNDYKTHAGWEGLIGEAVVDAARLGYYVGMGCTTIAVRVLCFYVSGAARIKGLHLQESEGVRPVSRRERRRLVCEEAHAE